MTFVLGLLAAVVGFVAWYRLGRCSSSDYGLAGLSRRGAHAVAAVAAVLALEGVGEAQYFRETVHLEPATAGEAGCDQWLGLSSERRW